MSDRKELRSEEYGKMTDITAVEGRNKPVEDLIPMNIVDKKPLFLSVF